MNYGWSEKTVIKIIFACFVFMTYRAYLFADEKLIVEKGQNDNVRKRGMN